MLVLVLRSLSSATTSNKRWDGGNRSGRTLQADEIQMVVRLMAAEMFRYENKIQQ